MNFVLCWLITGLFIFTACRQEERGSLAGEPGEADETMTGEEGEGLAEAMDTEEFGEEEGSTGELMAMAEEEGDAPVEISQVQGGLSLPVVSSALTPGARANYARYIAATAVNTATTRTVVCTLEGVEGSRVLKANQYRRFGRSDVTVLCDLFIDGELIAFASNNREYCLGSENQKGRLQEIQEELQAKAQNLQCGEEQGGGSTSL